MKLQFNLNFFKVMSNLITLVLIWIDLRSINNIVKVYNAY